MRHKLISLLVFSAMALAIAPTASAGRVVEDIACAQAEVTVYFQPGEATLSPQAERMLDALAAQNLPCSLASVETRPLALDAKPGAARTSLAAARERAVLAALSERGLVADARITLASDDSGPETGFPAGRAVQARLSLLSPRIG